MPAQPAKVAQRRIKRTPPHVPLGALRHVARITLDELGAAIGEITGERPTRGALSAIESGTRGASAETLRAIEQVYGLQPGSITTAYRPRLSPKNGATIR